MNEAKFNKAYLQYKVPWRVGLLIPYPHAKGKSINFIVALGDKHWKFKFFSSCHINACHFPVSCIENLRKSFLSKFVCVRGAH